MQLCLPLRDAGQLAQARLILATWNWRHGPALAASCSARPAHAAEGAPVLDGSTVGLWWALPFAGLLLSIAARPQLSPHFWHRHFGKIAAAWALLFLLPFAATYGLVFRASEVLHVALREYLPFVILLFALFVISGGIRVRGNMVGTPAVNTGLLAFGAALASVAGTTGADMLLVRPLIQANFKRRHNAHVLVFFIFLVANIGGSLTPLGDPPLFLTILPVLAILRAGGAGALARIVALATGPDGLPDNSAYFWMTGLLSSFLDNAPTCLVFFNMAGGDPQALMGSLWHTLLAISAGSVFMGAMTYIGNAPNFMVRSIASERGIRMPSFLGYMGWSCAVLLPVFGLVTLVFFRR